MSPAVVGHHELPLEEPDAPRDPLCLGGRSMCLRHDAFLGLHLLRGGDAPLSGLLVETSLALLHTKFGEEGGTEQLSAFPVAVGGVRSKQSVVPSVIRFAGIVNLPVRESMGRNRLGGNSFRLWGSRHLAEVGLGVHIVETVMR